MNCEQMLMTILDCGDVDLKVLYNIDSNIMEACLVSMSERNESMHFKDVYLNCARIAMKSLGVNSFSCDTNYSSARVYVYDEKIGKKWRN